MKEPFKGFINKRYPDGCMSQDFGENPALYSALGTGLIGHNGIDYVAPYGTPMYAVKDFEVIFKATNPTTGYGYELWFMNENEIWIYAHCSKTLVNVGDVCPEGTYVADMGNTGFVVTTINANGYWTVGANKYAGTHLHISKRYFHWYDPAVDKFYHGDYKGKRYTIENMDNGYNGWVSVKSELDAVSEQPITTTPQSKPTYIGGVNVQDATTDLNKQGFLTTWEKIVYMLKKYFN